MYSYINGQDTVHITTVLHRVLEIENTEVVTLWIGRLGRHVELKPLDAAPASAVRESACPCAPNRIKLIGMDQPATGPIITDLVGSPWARTRRARDPFSFLSRGYAVRVPRGCRACVRVCTCGLCSDLWCWWLWLCTVAFAHVDVVCRCKQAQACRCSHARRYHVFAY